MAALTKTDLPEDPNYIFLTVGSYLSQRIVSRFDVHLQSWGEWWNPYEKFPLSLDEKLQDEFCPSQEDLELEVPK